MAGIARLLQLLNEEVEEKEREREGTVDALIAELSRREPKEELVAWLKADRDSLTEELGNLKTRRAALKLNVPAYPVDAKLTAFLEALRDAAVEDIGGGMGLLTLAPGTCLPDDPTGGCHALIVRDFFPALFERLQQGPAWLLTGIPGIGKSRFVWYAVHRLLQLETPPAIVWESKLYNGSGAIRRVLFKDGAAHVVNDDRSFEKELADPSTWYFCDGLQPPLFRARTVMVAAHERALVKNWIEARPDIELTMPLWTWSEVEAAWRHLYRDTHPKLPLDRVRRCFELYYGGVPRLVLEEPAQYDDDTRDGGLIACAYVRVAAYMYGNCPELGQCLVHMDADRATFRSCRYRFATPHVASAFVERLLKFGHGAELATVLRMAEGDHGWPARRALWSMLFEPLAHRACIRGGEFEYRVLDGPPPGSPRGAAPRAAGGKHGRRFNTEAATAVAEAAETAAKASEVVAAAAAPAEDTASAAAGDGQVAPAPLRFTQEPLSREVHFAAASGGDPSDVELAFGAAVRAGLRGAPPAAYLRPSHPPSRRAGIDACVLPDRLLRITVGDGYGEDWPRGAVDEQLLERHLRSSSRGGGGRQR
ncbi:hypothetical protein GPECTOR_25g387 [Gonium pectorale]|uniref:Uncharacterized protein n=1 Tax=Gonium pectorale TaxID=33097 RepID=A0A150GG88_GONPE|nr:hypothetical protein GPECTOR_25g387 [Gonium pectorale]|eukprot:KXZ48803.1 hypothetical protein GPECTOR_25g387 [Gonium pectorale]